MDEQVFLDALVRRILAGDPSAFETIVRSLEWPLRTWLVTRCPPGADVDDIAQSAFVEAFLQIGAYTPGTDFRAWLFTIARFQLMAECTRLRRLADYHSRYVPHALAETLEHNCKKTDIDEPERLLCLRQCLEELAESSRKLIRWRYEQNLSVNDMAAQLNRTAAAIKKQLFLLRKKLHECIQRKLASSAL